MTTQNLNRYYDLEYFSGAQAALYIGDVWVDEVTTISYVRRQSKVPLYGYASQLFDMTAKGQVIVQGQFSINYKEQGYLWAILRRWFDYGSQVPIGRMDMLEGKYQKALTDARLNPSTTGQGGRPITGSNGTQVSRAGIERLTSGTATKAERYKFYQSLGGYSSYSVKDGQDKVFEDIVEAFEDELWKTTDNDSLLQQLRRTDDNAFDGFDIYLTFGNYANPKANHTAQKIIGVRLTSEAKTVVIDGSPVQEVYEFIARTTL